MGPKQQTIFQPQRFSQEFLLSKSDPHPVKIHDEPTGLRDKSAIPLVLLKHFPRVLDQKALVHAIGGMENPSPFAAMAVHLDDALNRPETGTDTGLLSVAMAVDTISRKHNGLWGWLTAGRLGCVIPQRHFTEGVAIADNIRNDPSIKGNHRISVGIAGYPMINYRLEDIFQNTEKALAHAAFFGPESTVCFDAVSLNISGDGYYQNGDLSGAISEYRKALKLDPSNANVHNSLGVCYGIMRCFDEALNAFETVLWLAPDDAMAMYNSGLIHLFGGQKEIALSCFLNAGQLADDSIEIAYHAGRLLLENKQAQQALPYLEKAAGLDPKYAGVFRSLGECYEQADRLKDAVTAYNKAIKLNPFDAAALSALGWLYIRLEQNSDIASLYLDQSIEIDPACALYHFRKGQALEKQNRMHEALSAFRRARETGYDVQDHIDAIENKLIARVL